MTLSDIRTIRLTGLSTRLACGVALMALCGCVSTDKDAIAEVLGVDTATAAPQTPAGLAKQGQNYTDPMVVASAEDVGVATTPAMAAAYTETPAEPPADNGNIALQPAAINAGQTSIFSVRQPVETPEAAPTHGADGSIVPADLPAHGIKTTSTSLFSQPANTMDAANGAAAAHRPQPMLPPTRPKLKIGAAAQLAPAAMPQEADVSPAAMAPVEAVEPDAAALAVASTPAPQKKNFSIRKFLGMKD